MGLVRSGVGRALSFPVGICDDGRLFSCLVIGGSAAGLRSPVPHRRGPVGEPLNAITKVLSGVFGRGESQEVVSTLVVPRPRDWYGYGESKWTMRPGKCPRQCHAVPV